MQNLIIIIWFFIAIQESINIGTLQKEKKNQETLNNKTNITRKNWTSGGKILNLLDVKLRLILLLYQILVRNSTFEF